MFALQILFYDLSIKNLLVVIVLVINCFAISNDQNLTKKIHLKNFLNSLTTNFTINNNVNTLNNGKINRRRDTAKHDNEVLERVKSGIFYFLVRGKLSKNGASFYDFIQTEGHGFCTVYENKIYFITREKNVECKTRFHRKDLITPRYYVEKILNNKDNNWQKYVYCQSRENPSNYENFVNEINFEVYIVAKSNKDDRWLRLEVENSMQYNDLAILTFEDKDAVDPSFCLKFDETGVIPKNGTVRAFVRNSSFGNSNGTLVGPIEGRIEKTVKYTCVLFPSVKTIIGTNGTNSGSPLFNKKGEVVGIDGEDDVNESLMGKTLAKIVEYHHKNKSGLFTIKDVDLEFERKQSSEGVLVLDSRTGHFRKGDIIKSCNKHAIKNLNSLMELFLFLSNGDSVFPIDCIVERSGRLSQVSGYATEMTPDGIIQLHKKINCWNLVPEFDPNFIKSENINRELFTGLNVDCQNYFGRTINYTNSIERTFEEIRNTSLYINTILLVRLGNVMAKCDLVGGSAFITRENGNFYVVSNQHVILSEKDTPFDKMNSCAANVIEMIKNKSLKHSICEDRKFEFSAEFLVRAVARNKDEFILKNPFRNVNSIKMLDVVVTTFLNKTSPKDFLEFADDIPRLNDVLISVGNQQRKLQTYSIGKVTEEYKRAVINKLGTRYNLNIWTKTGNSGAAIVRVKDKKVIGLDGLGLNEITHTLSAPFLHKLVKLFDKYKRIMLFHPVGIQLMWLLESYRYTSGAYVDQLINGSFSQLFKERDKIIKINNESVDNPDDVITASTLAADNIHEISINNEKKYGSYVRITVMRYENEEIEVILDNVPIVEMSNAELDDIEYKVFEGEKIFNGDFTEEVKKTVCKNIGKDNNPSSKHTAKVTMNTVKKIDIKPATKISTITKINDPITHTKKVTIKTVTKQSTKTVRKPDIKTTKTSTTSKSSKSTSYKTSKTTSSNHEKLSESTSKTITDTSYTPVSSTVSTPSDVEYTLFSDPSTDIDTSHTSVSYDTFSVSTFYTSLFYTSTSAGSTHSEYNVPSKPSTSNKSYVITVTVISTLFCIAFIILLIMVLRWIKIKIRINCFGRRPSTENDLFDQSTLNESFKDKIKEFIKSNIPKKNTNKQ